MRNQTLRGMSGLCRAFHDRLVWTMGTARKDSGCYLCGSDIPKGHLQYRPLTETRKKTKRMCQPCGSART